MDTEPVACQSFVIYLLLQRSLALSHSTPSSARTLRCNHKQLVRDNIYRLRRADVARGES